MYVGLKFLAAGAMLDNVRMCIYCKMEVKKICHRPVTMNALP